MQGPQSKKSAARPSPMVAKKASTHPKQRTDFARGEATLEPHGVGTILAAIALCAPWTDSVARSGGGKLLVANQANSLGHPRGTQGPGLAIWLPDLAHSSASYNSYRCHTRNLQFQLGPTNHAALPCNTHILVHPIVRRRHGNFGSDLISGQNHRRTVAADDNLYCIHFRVVLQRQNRQINCRGLLA